MLGLFIDSGLKAYIMVSCDVVYVYNVHSNKYQSKQITTFVTSYNMSMSKMGLPKFKALLVCIHNITRNHNAILQLRVDEESKHLI